MATKKATKASTNGHAPVNRISDALAAPPKSGVKIAPVRKRTIELTIRGTTPLVMHQWSAKALQMMRDKHAGKKTKNRDVRDPQAEGEEAMYRDSQGRPAFRAASIKAAMVSAAHKDLGVEKTLVKKAVFVVCSDPTGNLTLSDYSEPEIREDVVRVGMGSTDLRYRPYFMKWSIRLHLQTDGQLLTVEDVLSLLDRAGFSVGIGEMRPEKSVGEYGRFEVDRTQPIEVTEEAID